MKEERLAIGGAIVAALAASLCCIGPLLFVMLGAGAFGAATVFESARPYLLSAATLLLGFGFYRTYFRWGGACAPGAACATKPVSRASRAGLWSASVAVAAFAFSPYYAGTLASKLSKQNTTSVQPTAPRAQSSNAPSASEPASGTATTTLTVEGMTCASCETTIDLAVEQTPGVRSASASFERSEVVVEYDPTKVTPAQLAQSVNDKTDYKATPRQP